MPWVADRHSGVECPLDFSHSWFVEDGIEQIESSDPQF